MSCMLGSQGLVVATAMVVSTTVLFIAFSRQKSLFPTQHQTTPRSCLYSDEKKKERNKKKKKKVQFAENVKEPSGNGKEFRERQKRKRNREIHNRNSCGNEIPQNHVALYSGILKDRLVQRYQCSY